MAGKSVEILFVEDNPFDILLIERTSKQHSQGATIRILPDGPDLMDFLQCKGRYIGQEMVALPKLIVLDLHLPKVPGLEILKMLKAHPQFAPIPVIIFSSRVQEEEVNESYHLGANSYIRKPLDMGDYRRIISQIFDYWLVLNSSFSASVFA